MIKVLYELRIFIYIKITNILIMSSVLIQRKDMGKKNDFGVQMLTAGLYIPNQKHEDSYIN